MMTEKRIHQQVSYATNMLMQQAQAKQQQEHATLHCFFTLWNHLIPNDTKIEFILSRKNSMHRVTQSNWRTSLLTIQHTQDKFVLDVIDSHSQPVSQIVWNNGKSHQKSGFLYMRVATFTGWKTNFSRG